MSRFLKDRYKSFQSYTPGEQPQDQEYIKLNTNESPYPPAPEVMRALKETDLEKLRLYPDPTGRKLKEKIAGLYDVKPENVFLSNGSDDILNFSFLAFNDAKDNLIFPDITYSFYKVIAGLHGVSYREVPLKEDFTIDVDAFCSDTKSNVVIPNPNAPTGIELGLDSIRKIAEAGRDRLVLVDEAYVDFGGTSAVPLTKEYDNILVSQTFSKSRSFAGGRLGFAIGNESLIKDLELIQYSTNPYNVNRLSMILAEASLDADDYYKENSMKIQKTREWTASALEALGAQVLPSKSNFVFATVPGMSGEDLYSGLKKKGILIRHWNQPRIENWVRITIGTDQQMEKLAEAMKEMVK
ncbi:histidinol-phosphate transaminase [Baileyella intestinalis]|uniref:histidinol-phosphate transaminase n=1 Tax=Baileyella intestinalis TaxID=2606709 RepID=UPI0022E94AC5|nr:histidinol-phosphate transaminase [Baileyella intestinalis]